MGARPLRLSLLAVAALLLLAIAVARLVGHDEAGDAASDRAPAARQAAEPAVNPAPRAGSAIAPAPSPPTGEDGSADPLDDFARASAWAAVDLDAVRAAMPNKL